MGLSPFEMIFGGQNQRSTSQSSSTPQNMNPFTTALMPTVMGLADKVSGGVPQYNGPMFTPMTGNEGALLGNLMGMNNQGGGVAGTNDYLAKVINGNFLPGQPGGNPFLEGAITAAQRTTMNNLETTLGRTLPGYFTAAGHMISPNNNNQGGSSAFDTAAALATRGAATTMGDIAATISGNAYNSERQNQQQATGMSMQEVNNTISNLQAQSLPRMIQELGIERGLNLYQTNVTGLLQLLQTLGGISSPVIGNAAVSNSTATGNQTPGILKSLTSLFAPSGGGGGQVAAAATG